jgi:beta-lactam-binding protein with PASTA domain
MLGDSVRRRQGPSRKPAPRRKEDQAAIGRRWKLWLAVLVAVSIPFIVGYTVAVRVLFPPPPVVAEGIAVPRVVGQTLARAQRSIADAGLGVVESSELPSLTAPVGSVIAQSPLPGQQLRAGQPVRVAISSGLPRVFVPDVVGFPVERAASLLVRLGFQVQRTDEVAEADSGRVIDINPRVGSQITLPARIAITVSLGPPPDTTAVDTLMLQDTAAFAPQLGWSERLSKRIFTEVQQVTRQGDTPTDGRY